MRKNFFIPFFSGRPPPYLPSKESGLFGRRFHKFYGITDSRIFSLIETPFLRRQICFAPTRTFLLRPYPIITKKRYFLYGPSCFWKSRSEKLRLTWTPDKQYVQYLIKEPFPVLVYPIRLKQDKIFVCRNWKVRQTIILALFKNF